MHGRDLADISPSHYRTPEAVAAVENVDQIVSIISAANSQNP